MAILVAILEDAEPNVTSDNWDTWGAGAHEALTPVEVADAKLQIELIRQRLSPVAAREMSPVAVANAARAQELIGARG